jgi:hypothetical protein
MWQDQVEVRSGLRVVRVRVKSTHQDLDIAIPASKVQSIVIEIPTSEPSETLDLWCTHLQTEGESMEQSDKARDKFPRHKV